MNCRSILVNFSQQYRNRASDQVIAPRWETFQFILGPSFEQNSLHDHRDFPRLNVEAKVRIRGLTSGAESDALAIISDLSLGGARLATTVELQLDQAIELIPVAGLQPDHPLHHPLRFTVVWQSASDSSQGAEQEWDYYGLRHQGSVLDILESWIGHLLLRRHKTEDVVLQRRQHRRLRLPEEAAAPLRAVRSHDQSDCELHLIDLAPGGLLARGDSDLPVGLHLEFPESPMAEPGSLFGSIVDTHVHSGSTFYRVCFDPDSELDEEHILHWANRVGGTFE